MKKFLNLGLVAAGVISAGCSSTSVKTVPQSTSPEFFSGNSKLLKEVPGDSDDMQIYRYVSSELNKNNYHAVIIDPVIIYQNQGESVVSNEVINQTKAILTTHLQKSIAQKFRVTETPGSGVARLSVAIAGADIQGDGFKFRYLIPVSAVINLTAYAAGYEPKHAALEIASKITDSRSERLLGASVTTIRGEVFRDKSDLAVEFETLAIEWVDNSVKYAAGINK